MDKIRFYKETIYENIDYEALKEQVDSQRLDEIIDIMLECICSSEYSAPVEHPRPAKLNSTVAENEQHHRSSCTLIS
ncbi:DUF6017 domain-containing protein [Ruminococcus sp.]|uniref:DUF6017 domain-containing protein n=1 Tax=Ruminococcus sp. TaxID=41978 RepID=UPI0025F5B67D|nr:DUF6017 domain-containing protein [Ruminococcus sp.]